MLARSSRLPTSGDYAYELKWDGLRAIVSVAVQVCCSMPDWAAEKGPPPNRSDAYA